MTTTRGSSVAVVGCGEMGGAVARRLLAQGLNVIACDPDPQRTAPLLAAGARVAENAAEAANGAERLLVVVNTETQVRQVLAEVTHTRQLARRVAIMSTISPESMRELAQLYGGIVDAPVSGGPSRAADGRLTIMTGGLAADIRDLRPIFRRLATRVIHCGEPGAAQAAKIVNNVICHANTVLMAETLQLGLSQGINIETVRQVMEASTGRNYLTEAVGSAQRLYAGFTVDLAAFEGILGILRKDIDIATHVAAAAGKASPGLHALADLLHQLGPDTFETWEQIAAVPVQSA